MASSVKYFLFLFVFLSIIGGEVIISHNNAKAGSQGGTAGMGLVTANVTGASPHPGTVYLVIIFACIIIALFLLVTLKGKNLAFFNAKSHTYASLVLRLVLGVFLIMAGFNTTPDILGYVVGIAKMVAGVLLLIGVFVRPVSFLVFFFLLSQLFLSGQDYAVAFLLIAITVAIFLLGGKEFSVDARVAMLKSAKH